MMDTVDALMVLLFPFLDTIPFTMPRYWIFRGRLRIPFRYVVLVQFVLTAAYSASFYAVNLGGYEAAARWTTILRYVFMLAYLVCAFSLIKDTLPKLLFTWLLTLAWQFFVMGNANFIESRFFPDVSGRHPYLVYNVARIVIYLITCPFLLRFFLHTVRDGGIAFEAGIDYPDGCPVSSTDITVLLGNLLENAVEACKREAAGGPQTIKLRVKRRGSSTLLILVDNPCVTPVMFDGDTPLSSKREGAGIGVESVREIAARYGGTVQFEQKGGAFYASVLLKLVPDGAGETAPAGEGAFPLKQ